MVGTRTRWGSRAAALYTEDYAARYRAHDDAIRDSETVARFDDWLRGVCARFDGPIDALDLGCGTGRFFHALTQVRRLVGIDVSPAMLDRARRPVGGSAAEDTTLVEGDFLTHEFGANEFDLVYSIGVLAEHSPLDLAIAVRVARWLRPGGRLACTAVHVESPSIPKTISRRVAEAAAATRLVPAAIRRAIKRRLIAGGLYADEAHVRDVLVAAGFVVESIEPFESDVHRHLLAVARRP